MTKLIYAAALTAAVSLMAPGFASATEWHHHHHNYWSHHHHHYNCVFRRHHQVCFSR